jgi:hypothetical protein
VGTRTARHRVITSRSGHEHATLGERHEPKGALMYAREAQFETRRDLSESELPFARASKRHAGRCEASPANICTVPSPEAIRLALRRQAIGRG